ncbi:MAG TPA: ABC transporter ATP-binding protein [Bordetella sp.]|nr:ABC transporter ATP-binding protein [Bordetella sp.]
MAVPYLRLRNISKSYGGGPRAVSDVSIDIAKGEFVSFLGPSGSGKTTTLMMIAGFEQPTQGAIEIAGEDISRKKAYERNIGVVFQNYALFPHMTIARNVGFPLNMRHRQQWEIDKRVARVLDMVGLSAHAGKYPRELSGGQQQRVALARGLVFDPDVLLFDEPLGALDKNLREQMQIEIKRIHREVGITMIYVTHDQTEAMTMSDRVAVFNNGRIDQVAPPLDVYNRPATRFVGGFVGDSNFLSGHVDVDRPGLVLVPGLGPVRTAAADAPPGKKVELMIRPERIRVLPPGAPQEENSYALAIHDLVHYGDSVLVLGAVEGVPMRVRISGNLPEHVVEGESIRIGWAPRDGYLLQAA